LLSLSSCSGDGCGVGVGGVIGVTGSSGSIGSTGGVTGSIFSGLKAEPRIAPLSKLYSLRTSLN